MAPRPPGSGPPRPPSGSPSRDTAIAVGQAVILVVAALASLSLSLVALVTTVAMATRNEANSNGAWPWVIGVFVTLGVPLLLAVWKHAQNPHRIPSTMSWIPAVWNLAGLIIALQLVPDLMGTALRSFDLASQGRFGNSQTVPRVSSAVLNEAADTVDPRPAPPPPPLPLPSHIDLDRSLTVPFLEEGAAMFIDAELQGPKGAATHRYLFDTGASYTTITSKMAAELGIEIPNEAPTLEFNTATGRRTSRMVYLPMLKLGQVEIPGLLVSVCDACANEQADGLLGLNVTREFFVQMDYQGERMTLLPRIPQGRPNRAYDIDSVLTREIEGRPEIWLGRVRWVILLHNRGTQAVENVLPQVNFRNGPVLYGERVERIEPGETGRSLLVGRAVDRSESGPVEFTLMLAEAYW